MTSTAFVPPLRRSAAALVLTFALVLLALAPSPAAAGRDRGTLTLVELRPLFKHDARGIVRLTVRPGERSIVVAGDLPQSKVDLRLSRRSCGKIPRDPSGFVFIGGGAATGAIVDGRYGDDLKVKFRRSAVRDARSMVLLARRGEGEADPRACGNVNTWEVEDFGAFKVTDARFGPRRPQSWVTALLLPFADFKEHAVVQVTRGRRKSSISVGGRDGDDAVTYSLRLSRRSCAGLERNADRPRFIGSSLIEPLNFTNTFFDDAAVRVSTGDINASKSVVLAARVSDDKLEPRACGRRYYLDRDARLGRAAVG
jgi:hypothetical protein